MTTRNDSPTIGVADLPRVDPPARVSRAVRAYAAFLATGLGRWIAKTSRRSSTRGCSEPPGAG
jgi:hypothetical protein